MKQINLQNLGMSHMSVSEELTIIGGHDGWAYEIGNFLGKAIKVVGEVAAVVAIVVSPKS